MSEVSKNETDGNVRKKNLGGRPKGYPKTGGRTKKPVDPNKHNWDDILKGAGFNIPIKAIELFNDDETTNNLKFSILQFLAQYTTPSIKPKDKDEDSNPGNNDNMPSVLEVIK